MSGNETKAVSAPAGQEGVGALKKHKVSLIGMIGLFFCTAAGGAFGIEEMIPAAGPVSVLPTFVNAILLALTVFKARKLYPVEERRKKGYTYVIPCGKAGLYYVVGSMIVVCIGAFLLNGADYFFAGLLCAFIMIILYIVLKRHYGGLSALDPAAYPLNPKTKLCCGAIKDISVFCAALGATGITGFFFLRWYEGDWGREYYKEEYGDLFIFGDFEALLYSILIYGITMLVAAGGAYYIHKKVG